MLSHSCAGPHHPNFSLEVSRYAWVAPTSQIVRSVWCLRDTWCQRPSELCGWPLTLWDQGVNEYADAPESGNAVLSLSHTSDAKRGFKMSNRTKKHLSRRHASVPPKSSRKGSRCSEQSSSRLVLRFTVPEQAGYYVTSPHSKVLICGDN